jgi:hypothetical protein
MITRLQEMARSLRWDSLRRPASQATVAPVTDELLDEALLGRLRAIQIDLRNLPTHGLAGEHR